MSANKSIHTLPFAFITFLFFAWGFITCLNDLLIPHFKQVFELTYFQAMLVQFAFFSAYFFVSLIYFLLAKKMGDPILKVGYQKALVVGLAICSLGSALFIAAAFVQVFYFFLAALFLLAGGITLIQIAANPYVAVLGVESGASARLNLSQGLNSLGYTIAPVLGGGLLFSAGAQNTGTEHLMLPYAFLSLGFAFLAFLFSFISLPKINVAQAANVTPFNMNSFPGFKKGMAAIFVYVGAEVAIGSILINYIGLENVLGYSPEIADKLLAFYWGGLMIGRFNGAVSLSSLSKGKKIIYTSMLTAVSTAIIYGISFNAWEGLIHFKETIPFLIMVLFSYLLFVLGTKRTGYMVMQFALIVSGLLLLSIFTQGSLAGWALIGIGLFNSIMWSNIFTLSIKDLGEQTSLGSSLLVMMIVGGALIPPIQGLFADFLQTSSGSESMAVRFSLLIPLLCYLYLVYFGWSSKNT